MASPGLTRSLAPSDSASLLDSWQLVYPEVEKAKLLQVLESVQRRPQLWRLETAAAVSTREEPSLLPEVARRQHARSGPWTVDRLL